MLSTATREGMKEQVVDNLPKRIKEVKFGIMSPQDVVKQGVIEVATRELFDLEGGGRKPKQNGALDPRMGTSSKSGVCETCGEGLTNCNGHFGHVKLALPAFHIGYFKATISILQNICKQCSRILLDDNQARAFLKQLRTPGIDNLRRMNICKKINEQCKKTKICYNCGALNGVVKKAGPLKIVHDKFRAFNASTAAKKVPPESKVVFEQSFEEAKKTNHDLDKHLKKAMDDLNPLKVLNMFKQILPIDCELLGMNPQEGRPEMFLWQYIPAPPICIRPSVQQDSASNEDDLTVKLTEIIFVNSLIRTALQSGEAIHILMERWDYMQAQIAMYIDSSLPSLQRNYSDLKPIRGFCQRLKGKQGRFRGNLSGKRVDFSGRTVISPDPNLSIDQVAVPILVAKNLTYPERVSRYNIKKLQQLVQNGPDMWPGANYIIKKDSDFKLWLKFGDRRRAADALVEGDIVERHLEDGDVVLFNRQPSLHKLSILSHYAKIRPWRTFRLNECVCNPYNADFDGDEMNLHVPQTEEARTEAIELMGVKNNLCTPRNGEPIIAAIQDFITASYLLSSKDRFYNRKTFANICMFMVDGNMQIDIPPPAVLKPQRLWTGKQIFNVLMRPNKKSKVLVNLDAKCRDFKAVPGKAPDMCPNDGWLVIRGSEIMCGLMDKSTVGSGKKDSVFYVILRDYGPDEAVQAMNRLAKLCARWLANQGFSIGINDVLPGTNLRKEKDKLVEQAYDECDSLILDFKEGKLEKQAGCDEEITLENKVQGILSNVRDKVGDICMRELSKNNSPLIMANSGSKGSKINVSQMVACVGQQVISGKRVPDGFQDRSLPHFPKNSKQPPSKGFVRNSFFSGLTPTEFLFHAISGREGLVDTAVKTAETGYMSRRLMKSLEDLSASYDYTVRTSSSGVVQFQYGGDNLDPVAMEGNALPVNFNRTFYHCENITFSNADKGLLPYEIVSLCDEVLNPLQQKLPRIDLLGNTIPDKDLTDRTLDEHESKRRFYNSIRDFMVDKARKLSALRLRYNLPSHEEPPDADYMDVDDSYFSVHDVNAVNRIMKISEKHLREFLRQCLSKYEKAKVEPGSAVGAVGAQSIGEPGTQMTLKTFHFAGVASMNVTLGVPRIKEIINASKVISTPIITCTLVTEDDERAARIVKGRIEKTYLEDIISYIQNVSSRDDNYVSVRLDQEAISKLQLELTTDDIVTALVKAKLKINRQDIRVIGNRIRIYVHEVGEKDRKRIKEESEVFLRVQQLKRALPRVAVKGYPNAARAVVKKDDKTGKNQILVEGYGLKLCMNTDGVVGTKTKSNSIMEMREVLGIEAARGSIIDEISYTMREHGMDIDPRHMQLLGDVMTYKGEVLGITRFGLAKMRDSVLQLASFEKTTDHLFEAAFHMKSDAVEGVSECIILGQSMSIGTGAFKVVRRLMINPRDLVPKKLVFEEAYSNMYRHPSKKPGRGR
ncbi:beta and beta-prime subunits of DNA dependent RNA-polymerase [Choiromyces venosus 120613-1]|uniref:DNA-directed RNA polymerase subunit n=1 Tax=Choiromyces venosus 120613-1 TaxID=1336337 RepID=A0A3N4JYZ1_9PEZI|nr:beta and beta-prime subunits of DNA dependent RNA-polymerase [Choiromyces venosus 120613-1]